MSTATIRLLEAADYDAWYPLWQSYLTFYESTLSDDVTKASFAAMTDPAVLDREGFVAEKDGEIIGIVHLIYHAHNWHAANVCYLQDLYVSAAARGTGAGRALIEATYAQAEKRGAASVYWTTQEHNATARKLYDRIGKLTPFIKYQKP